MFVLLHVVKEEVLGKFQERQGNYLSVIKTTFKLFYVIFVSYRVVVLHSIAPV